MDDRLSRMIALQAELTMVLGVDRGAHTDSFTQSQLGAAIGMSCEAAEVLDVINTQTRKWKQKPFVESLARAREEVIDVLLYTLEFLSLIGVDADGIEQELTSKAMIVFARVVKSVLTKEQIMDYLDKAIHGFSVGSGPVINGIDYSLALARLVSYHPSILLEAASFCEDPVAYVESIQKEKNG